MQRVTVITVCGSRVAAQKTNSSFYQVRVWRVAEKQNVFFSCRDVNILLEPGEIVLQEPGGYTKPIRRSVGFQSSDTNDTSGLGTDS